MNKGELWVIELPFISGREQRGTRPGLVLANTKTDLIIIIPLTSNQQTLRYPCVVKITSSEENNLETDSIALLFQIQAIDKRRMLKKIGLLENSWLDEINSKLKKMLQI